MDETTQNRKVYLDYLRVFAMLSVIMIHVIGEVFSDDIQAGSNEWMFLSILNILTHWAVPIFLMISGTLFLSKDIPIRIIYKKYILRLAIAFIFWSFVYQVYTVSVSDSFRIRDIISDFIAGYTHLWYLWLIIGMYMLIPILRIIVKNEKIMKYFLILSGIFAFLIPSLRNVDVIDHLISGAIGNMNINFVLGYTFFFVGGYYFGHYEMSRKFKYLLYLCTTIVLVYDGLKVILYGKMRFFSDTLYPELNSITILLLSVSVYLVFKDLGKNKSRTPKLTMLLSQCSFGVYLVHYLILNIILSDENVYTLFSSLYVEVPLIFGLTFAISFAIVFILKKIPIVNKYLV